MTSHNDKGEIMYKYLDEREHEKMKQMNDEHLLIYKIIVESYDKGVTAADIKNKLSSHGFTAPVINKALKDMEKSNQIKKMPSI